MDDLQNPGLDSPNLDVARWDHLIESIGPDSILVVIAGWMGAKLRQVVTPEDVWQETLLQAWRDRETHRWENLKKFRSWILAIARNRIHDTAEHLGARKRGGGNAAAHFSSLVDSRSPGVSAILPGRSTTPSRIASHRERATLMEAALDTLPEDQQVIVRRYLFEEQPMERIAADLELAVSTAWYRFRKGSERYARELASLQSQATPRE
ncbi:MAG: sigma-70 family RNA polymerase sigma factor [Planctomycetes bacterium]|nr:sigma-70 family RNA polymerase sigma factor [Planctomycetota bacterium]